MSLARLTLRWLRLLLRLRLGLTLLLVLRRRSLAVWRRRRLRAVGQLKAVADDVEILLGQVSFEQMTGGRVEELDGDGVLAANGGAYVFDRDGLAVKVALLVGLRSKCDGDEEAILFWYQRPGV